MNVAVGIHLNMLTRPTISQSRNRCVSSSICVMYCQFIYPQNANKGRIEQLFPPETSGLITDATYSCDSWFAILSSSTLALRCRISSAAYLPNNPNVRVHALVIAALPHEADQFAVGVCYNDGNRPICATKVAALATKKMVHKYGSY